MLATETYQVFMWMMNFKGSCPKRTVLLANTPLVAKLQSGKLKRSGSRVVIKTTIKYKNKEGKDCYKGSAQLKATQSPG